GGGCAAVVAVYWYTQRGSLLTLARHHALELSFLLVATLYSFTIPLKGSLALYDAVVLIGLVAAYLWLAARNPSEELEVLRAGAGMGALISSKVNQWTLLIGGLPLAYALSRGGVHALPLDARQVEELLLTAAQSLFAVAVIASLSISIREALTLLVLFLVQL